MGYVWILSGQDIVLKIANQQQHVGNVRTQSIPYCTLIWSIKSRLHFQQHLRPYIHTWLGLLLVTNDHVLLMTCRVVIRTTDDYIIQASALLDSGSSTSFVTECLTQQLHLSRKQRYIQVDSTGGIKNKASRSLVQFCVQPLNHGRTSLNVEAIIITSGNFELASQPCP